MLNLFGQKQLEVRLIQMKTLVCLYKAIPTEPADEQSAQ